MTFAHTTKTRFAMFLSTIADVPLHILLIGIARYSSFRHNSKCYDTLLISFGHDERK